MILERDGLDEEFEEELELEDDARVEDLLDKKGFSSEEVLVAVDGAIVSKNRELSDGARVKVMDVIAGG